jgi:hypothetical protein
MGRALSANQKMTGNSFGNDWTNEACT